MFARNKVVCRSNDSDSDSDSCSDCSDCSDCSCCSDSDSCSGSSSDSDDCRPVVKKTPKKRVANNQLVVSGARAPKKAKVVSSTPKKTKVVVASAPRVKKQPVATQHNVMYDNPVGAFKAFAQDLTLYYDAGKTRKPTTSYKETRRQSTSKSGTITTIDSRIWTYKL